MADVPRRIARAAILLVLAVAALFAPGALHRLPTPVLTTARITTIAALPDRAAHVVIVRGEDGRIGGMTIEATRLRCRKNDPLRAVLRDDTLLPDPGPCVRQAGPRPTR